MSKASKTGCSTKRFREGRRTAPSFAFAGRDFGSYSRAILLAVVSAIAFMFSLSGCSGEVKVDNRFVETFVELRVLEFTYGGDSPTTRLARQDVLKRYGYTREEYLTKMEELLEDENLWVPFQKAVNVRLDSLLQVPGQENAKKNTPPRTKKGSE